MSIRVLTLYPLILGLMVGIPVGWHVCEWSHNYAKPEPRKDANEERTPTHE